MGGDTFNSSRSKDCKTKAELNHGNIVKIKKKLYFLFRKTQSFFDEGFSPVLKIITGERIQLLCDHFLGQVNDFHGNPRIKKRKNRWLPIETINSSIHNKPRVFCYTHLLEDPTYLIKKLAFLKNPFVLVFHNSDYNFEEKHLVLFDHLPNMRHIFTQNMKVSDERVSPLPIGIANRMWRHGNLWLLTSMIKRELPKTDLVFFNFSINTNREKREVCYQKIKEKGIEFLPWRGVLPHWETLQTHKYAICPEGNGIDTYRFWECLYLKVIPICKRNILVEHFAKDFPVVLLDDWADLDLNQLAENYDTYNWKNWEKLDISTYENLIAEKVKSLTGR